MPAEFHEAPELHRKVEAGVLPPVRERLPEEPMVIGPGILIPESDLKWEVGTYGGVLVSASPGGGDNDISDACTEWLLNARRGDTEAYRPGIAGACDVNADNTQFTIHLRKGMRWSDGAPLTAEDVEFAYHKVIADPRVNPMGVPAELRDGGRADGDPAVLDILDAYTFRLTFKEPYGSFLNACPAGILLKPKHHLKRFHIDYTALEDMQKDLQAQEMGKAEWGALLRAKDLAGFSLSGKEAIGYPVLGPWMRVASPPGRIVMERNPYFFKVDIAGNQLPYIDRYESVGVGDAKIIPMLVIKGEVNMLRCQPVLSDLPLYAEHAKGKYQVVTHLTRHNPPWAVYLNLTNPDPSWRRVVNDLRFRQAFDKVIPRQQILDDLYFGLGRLTPWTPAKYDPKGAAALLDGMGMTRRDRDGYRLAPDGARFEVRFEINPVMNDLAPATELIAEELRDVGIRTTIKIISWGLYAARISANQLYASLFYLDTGHWANLAVLDFLPGDRAKYGPKWHEWMNTKGERGEAPPPWIREAYDMRRQFVSMRVNSSEADEALARLKRWMHGNLPMFPLTDDVTSLVIAPVGLGNLAHAGHAQAATWAAQQFFFRKTQPQR
jgi:peptide/nickel transport system substrate-binding protein